MVTSRTGDTTSYTTPKLSIEGEGVNEHLRISINKDHNQMTMENRNSELAWFATIDTLLDELGVDQETRKYAIGILGSKIFMTERLQFGIDTPISQLFHAV